MEVVERVEGCGFGCGGGGGGKGKEKRCYICGVKKKWENLLGGGGKKTVGKNRRRRLKCYNGWKV